MANLEADTHLSSRPVSYPLDTPSVVSTPQSRFRRQLLKGVLGTALGAAALAAGWTAYLFPHRRKQFPTGMAVGPVSKFAEGATPLFLPDAADAQYSVQNRGNGEFAVLSAICTHQGCSVEWDAKARQFLCPCHAGRYDASGQVLGGPPPSPLLALAHHVQNGILYLDS